MNKQIKKLAEQVGLNPEDIKVEQFAELLVNECAQVADCPNSFRHTSGSKILKHFNVKALV